MTPAPTHPDTKPWAPDHHRVGLFGNFSDAIAEASLRAALSKLRYRVRFEPNNCWWQITETVRPLDHR